MFVSAKILRFKKAGIETLKPGYKVQISSGMGGSYTLIIESFDGKKVKAKAINERGFTWIMDLEEAVFIMASKSRYFTN
mgnify:CR=1 FL=1